MSLISTLSLYLVVVVQFLLIQHTANFFIESRTIVATFGSTRNFHMRKKRQLSLPSRIRQALFFLSCGFDRCTYTYIQFKQRREFFLQYHAGRVRSYGRIYICIIGKHIPGTFIVGTIVVTHRVGAHLKCNVS